MVSVRGNEGTFVYSCVLLRFGNALRLTGLEVPLPQEKHTRTGNSPTILWFFWVRFLPLCVLKETGRECTPFVAKLNPFVCKKLCVWRRHKFSVA